MSVINKVYEIELKVGDKVNFIGNNLPHIFEIYFIKSNYCHLKQIIPYDKYGAWSRLFVDISTLMKIRG